MGAKFCCLMTVGDMWRSVRTYCTVQLNMRSLYEKERISLIKAIINSKVVDATVTVINMRAI